MIRLPYHEVLRTFLVICVIFKGLQVQANCSQNCSFKEETIIVTTTSITFQLNNCNILLENNKSVLTPGTTNLLNVSCAGVTCCGSFTTTPVKNLSTSEITHSTVSLIWTDPEGRSSFYIVEWNNGNETTNAITSNASFKATNLTAGVMYAFKVVAFVVTEVNQTISQNSNVTVYTKPDIIKNLTVFDITTSSVVLNWTKPMGDCSFYRVEWNNGSTFMNRTTTQTNLLLENLISGVNYTLAVITVAGDNMTESRTVGKSFFTKPEVIIGPTITSSKDSLNLNWTKPPGQAAGYRVSWTSGLTTLNLFTQAVSAEITGLNPGTSYTVQIIALAQDNITQGAPYNKTIYTKPEDVTNLSVSNITTSSVFLNWSPVPARGFYKVEWSNNNTTDLKNTSDTSLSISGLVAGNQYTFKVTAVAGDNVTEGNSNTATSFVKPEKPANVIVSGRGTNYLSVKWSLPSGRVDLFTVSLFNEALKPMTTDQNISNGKKEANFTDLQPGRLYLVTVTSIAGIFSSQSDGEQIATVPNPPGAVLLLWRTNSSLTVQWALPVSMETAPNITYNITYQSSSNIQTVFSQNNSFVLVGLVSGTLYNITVVTAGPQGHFSTPVQNSSFTLPNPVLSLRAAPFSTSEVSLMWNLPISAQSYYTYRVQIPNRVNAGFITRNTSFWFRDLESGTGYNFTVTTVAAQDIEAPPQLVLSYTKPKAVTNLRADYTNSTTLKLNWTQQDDYKPSYSYLVFVNGIRTIRTTDNFYLLTDLVPGSCYTIDVIVAIEGVESNRTTTRLYTAPGMVTGLVAIGTTTSLNVSWLNPSGQVESYIIQLLDSSGLLSNTTLSQTNTSNYVFKNLTPGHLYTVKVITQSGPFSQGSNTVQNATFPNPPGSLTVVEQRTSSINISWREPDNMMAERYSFSVQINSNPKINTSNNWFQFLNLKSGTVNSISVNTVGVLGYESSALTQAVSTKPYPVSNLTLNSVGTTSVTLSWVQEESQPTYVYRVATGNSSGSPFILNVSITTITIPELLSGSAYNSTVTTTIPDGSMATPVTVSYVTQPFKVNSLTANTLNTTAVNLTWDKPLQYQNSYTYRIAILGCVLTPQNYTVAREGDVVINLIPGTNCTFSVSVITRHNTEGDAVLIYQYTKPEVVQAKINNTGSNSSVLVSWVPPTGGVEQYLVVLSAEGGFTLQTLQNSSVKFWNFYGLNAATRYNATVTTISGPFNVTSGPVTTATFPNPPGPLRIVSKTTSSLSLRWEEAPLMRDGSFVYIVTYFSPENAEESVTTANQMTNLSGLKSGTPYTVSVVTKGPLDLRSEAVQMNFTTRPECILDLNVTSIAEKSVTLQWLKPTSYKAGYKYAVNYITSPVLNKTANETTSETTVITGLVPGTSYTFTVTTLTADGTEGAPVNITNCTKASPVSHLKCQAPNDPQARLVLSWSPPEGTITGFDVITYQANTSINNSHLVVPCNPTCSLVVSNLSHYTQYRVTIQSLACGLPSEIESCSNTTGITSPPKPPDNSKLVPINTQHDKFIVQLSNDILDNKNGPITAWGVLVTYESSTPETNLSVYLDKTYNDWKSGSAAAYLATVKNITQTGRSVGDQTTEIGDGKSWEGYLNPALTPLSKYRYAIALFTLLEIQPASKLVNVPSSFVVVTHWSQTFQLPQNPVINIAVGASLGVFAVLLIALIGFIVYWMRLRHKDNSDIQIHSLRAKVSVAVKVEDYEAYFKKQKADSNCGFAEEFEELKPVGTAQAKNSAIAMENKTKNRYNNVLPYDSSRVRLSTHGSQFDDYINANYIPGHNSRKEFIAAQGPLPATVDQFWRMIWEKNVLTLVMLTRCNEQGRVKCEEYWPANTKHFENITVTTTSELPLEDWTIREFSVKNVKTAETRSVRHFHFTAWPDHGVPETTELLINFRHLVREHMDQFSRHSPTIVHCSAGVGRTGTFIAIDRLIFQIERDSMVDVYGTIYDLRMHRPLMVQTEDQYVFLNQCAVDIIRSRTGTNVDLIYQNTAALTIYENVEPKKNPEKNGYHNA